MKTYEQKFTIYNNNNNNLILNNIYNYTRLPNEKDEININNLQSIIKLRKNYIDDNKITDSLLKLSYKKNLINIKQELLTYKEIDSNYKNKFVRYKYSSCNYNDKYNIYIHNSFKDKSLDNKNNYNSNNLKYLNNKNLQKHFDNKLQNNKNNLLYKSKEFDLNKNNIIYTCKKYKLNNCNILRSKSCIQHSSKNYNLLENINLRLKHKKSNTIIKYKNYKSYNQSNICFKKDLNNKLCKEKNNKSNKYNSLNSNLLSNINSYNNYIVLYKTNKLKNNITKVNYPNLIISRMYNYDYKKGKLDKYNKIIQTQKDNKFYNKIGGYHNFLYLKNKYL